MTQIFGFSGKLGSGKDFLAKALHRMLPDSRPTVFMAFADPMKLDVIVKDRIPREFVYGKKTEESRRALQIRGTEQGRNVYGKDVWSVSPFFPPSSPHQLFPRVRYAKEAMKTHEERGITRFFFTDVRFPEEVQFIESYPEGYVFRAVAPLRTQQRLEQEVPEGTPNRAARMSELMTHASETALDGWPFDDHLYLFNDPGQSSLDVLRDSVHDLYPTPSLERPIPDSYGPVFFVDLDDTICKCAVYYTEAVYRVASMCGMRKDEFQARYMEQNSGWECDRFTRDDFARRLVQATKGLPNHNEAAVFRAGMDVHYADFQPIEGSVDAVKRLLRVGKVVISTVGEKADQVRKLIQLGLEPDAIECTHRKDESYFRDLMRLYPGSAYHVFGDSMHRDIYPAQDAGIGSVFLVSEESPLSACVSKCLESIQKQEK